MEHEKELLEVGNGIGGESESIKKGSEYCSRCFVLEERCEKVEEWSIGLESDLEKKRNDIEELRRQTVVLQVQNNVLKSFPKTIKGSDEKSTQKTNGDKEEAEGEKSGVDLMEEVENDKVLELMIENKVLDCEKKKAESEVGFWKAKCEELESQVRVLENNLSSISGMTNVMVKPVVETELVKEECCDVATPLIHTLNGKASQINGSRGEILHEKRKEHSSQTRKQLNFGEETPDKMAPVTPAAGGLPALAGLIIDISDDDGEGSFINQHGPQQSMNTAHKLADLSSRNTMIVKDECEIEDDITHCYQGTPSLPASKRKRASHIVHSDSESDPDDNVPLHRLRKRYSNVATMPSLRGQGVPHKNSSESKSNRGIPTTGNFTDDETDDSESDSEGESLNGFIVSGSESDLSVADKCSEGDEIANSNEKSASESEDKSEGNVDYDEIMSMIGRKKDHLIKWEFEADMLAAFGKDPELCMKAVCALYRQQTSDEQSCKATIHQNQRGFSQCDATRGSILGEFLTDGDPEGGLKKSVEELLEFQPKGLELCIALATRYSKQLFAMYENKEDPLWPALGMNS